MKEQSYHNEGFTKGTTKQRPLTNAVGVPGPRGARVLRLPEVLERTGLSRATVYVLQAKDPTWPRKIRLTERTVGWFEAELDAWIASRAQVHAAA